ncbi:MAG TPA: tetratricopeptide repeat protein [Kofleriaceae bacterium]|nr:tetratricopeptide repeat protein [Kofleriaceae bacterium]
MRTSLLLALVAVTSTAVAAPKRGPAKAHFDRGVAAYQKKDYAAAAAALQRSYELDPDVETLFAWAQAERQQDHCEKAIELYEKLLASDLRDTKNKQAIQTKLAECKVLLATKPQPDPAPDVRKDPEPDTPRATPPPEDPPVDRPDDRVVDRAKPAHRAWWKDPIGLTLVGTGAIGLAGGTYFLLSASKANSDAPNAANYFEFERLHDRAELHGKLGVSGMVAGGVLLVGGVIWYATRPDGDRGNVSAFVSRHASGFAVRF